MKLALLSLAIPLVLLGCTPGWAVVVANETDELRHVRYFDAGYTLVFEVKPRSIGLLAIGNAPGPAAVDVLDDSCAYLESVRVEREGGTRVTLLDDVAEAAPTDLPQEIPEPQLERSDRCEMVPAGS